MNGKKPPFDWNEEFRCFLDGPRSSPPRILSSNIKSMVNKELNPSPQAVLAKLFAIHFVSGSVALFFCPQFGIGFHSQGAPLYGVFRWLGEYGCMLVCGAFFLGTTSFFAAILLKLQEVRVIRKSKGLQWALLSLLSIGFFLALREQESVIPLSLVATWFVGSLMGGASVFGLSYFFRTRTHPSLTRWG